jgi:sulfate/thiosulfate transport system permease protein
MKPASSTQLPGFRLSLGYTLVYLSLLVLLPLAAVVVRALQLSTGEFLAAVTNDRALAAYGLTFRSALAAALVNVVLGLLVAWVMVRYEFPFKRLFDALIDLPLALPTAVAGMVFAHLYGPTGWLGQYLHSLGIAVTYTPLGIVLVLIFTGFPFVVRTVQPVLASLSSDMEESAALLGASRWQAFRRVIVPLLLPSLLTGFALALARAIGEYGAVIFIAGNMPYRTEIAPLLIVTRLEEYALGEATAIAVVLLAFSLVLLLLINLLERWSHRHDLS